MMIVGWRWMGSSSDDGGLSTLSLPLSLSSVVEGGEWVGGAGRGGTDASCGTDMLLRFLVSAERARDSMLAMTRMKKMDGGNMEGEEFSVKYDGGCHE
jgi:hypothetical protein